jgi:hypothetical protein
VTWPNVVDFAATLSTVAVGAQTAILAYVNGTLEPDVYGGEDSARLRMARIYLAAHMGELLKRQGIGGAITNETVGAESISFSYTAPLKGAIESLETTSWGLEFQRITNSTRARLPMVV